MNYKVFSVFLLLTFHSLNIHSQETNNTSDDNSYNHFLEVGLGINYHAVRDQGTSPLTYRGFIPGIHLQYFFINNKFLWVIDENFFIGYLRTRNYSADKNKSVTYNNDLSFNAFYKAKQSEKTSLYIGGELGTLTDIRSNDKFNNASLNYEFFAYLAPSFMIEYNSSWKSGKVDLGVFNVNRRDRNYKLQYAVSVPVISTLLRPGFVTINDFVDNKSLPIDMDNVKLVSVDHFFLIKNRFNFYYILHNNNMLKFNYNLNYFSYYRNYNPVKGFNSSFFVSIVFRFNNND